MASKPKPRAPAQRSNVLPIKAEFSEGGGNPSFSGGGGGGQSAWESSVETRLGELRTDVRNLLIAGILAVVLLVGSGWVVYGGAMGHVRELAVAQQNTMGRIETLDAKISGKLDTIGAKLDAESGESSRAPSTEPEPKK